MMPGRARILCVGKLNEPFLRTGCAEYEKRLTRYIKLEIQEVRDRPDALPDERALGEEAEELLDRLTPDEHVVALAIQGRETDSPAFSKYLGEKLAAAPRVTFLIGGSRGLHEKVLARANDKLSFSPMTFPHGLARLMLLEQIYRACRIASGEKYHK